MEIRKRCDRVGDAISDFSNFCLGNEIDLSHWDGYHGNMDVVHPFKHGKRAIYTTLHQRPVLFPIVPWFRFLSLSLFFLLHLFCSLLHSLSHLSPLSLIHSLIVTPIVTHSHHLTIALGSECRCRVKGL